MDLVLNLNPSQGGDCRTRSGEQDASKCNLVYMVPLNAAQGALAGQDRN